jgi:hypothetical protein
MPNQPDKLDDASLKPGIPRYLSDRRDREARRMTHRIVKVTAIVVGVLLVGILLLAMLFSAASPDFRGMH